MIDQKLLEMLRCPIDGSRLKSAENSVLTLVNDAISRGELRDRLDQAVTEPIDGGLINEKGTRLYPIRGGIPTLVADEAIEMDAVSGIPQ